MNLNKFTKAELISKLKRSDVKNNNKINEGGNNQTAFSKLIELILTFKNILIKLTLISFLIKIFKKYSLFRRLWTLLNTIVMGIFGISLIDNFGLDFITNFITEIKVIAYSITNYLSNTHFYSFIASLFSKKEEVTKEAEVSLRERSVSGESSRNESKIGESKRNSKISEWLKPETEVIQEESNNKKYLIIAALLILAGLSWYYSDEIKTGGISIIEWIRSFRPRPGDDSADVSNNIPSNYSKDLKTRLKGLFNKEEPTKYPGNMDNSSQVTITPANVNNSSSGSSSSNGSIILEDNSNINKYFPIDKGEHFPLYKGKGIADGELSQIEIDRRVANAIEIQHTGLTNISNADFETGSNALLQEIRHFMEYYDNASFPKEAVKFALSTAITLRLQELSRNYFAAYTEKFVNNDDNNELLERFYSCRESIYGSETNPLDENTNTYNDVAQAAEQEQEVWSDRGNSPSPKVLSPVQESITQVMSPGMATYAIDDQQIQDYRSALSPQVVENTIQEVDNQETSILDNILDDEPVIDENPFSAVLAAIRSRRSVIEDNIENQAESSYVLQETELDPLINNPDYQQAIWDSNKINTIQEENVPIDINQIIKPTEELPKIEIDSSSSSDSSKEHYFPKQELTEDEIKSGFKTINENISDNQIAGSPNLSQLGLNPTTGPSRLSPLTMSRPSLSNLRDDTDALFDNNDIPSPIWDKVEVKNNMEYLLADNSIDIDFKELWNRAKTIICYTNDDQKVEFKFNSNLDRNFSQNFNWGSQVNFETHGGWTTALKEVIIIDLDGKPHSVYQNLQYFK